MRARRLAAWLPPQRNINTAIAADGDLTVRRAREIVLGNALATNAADAFVANAVGTGIKPSPLLDDAAAKQAIQELWLAWTDEADADGLTDFYGLQALVARELFVAGECFVRLRPRRPSDGLQRAAATAAAAGGDAAAGQDRDGGERQSDPLRHRVRRDRPARRLLVPAQASRRPDRPTKCSPATVSGCRPSRCCISASRSRPGSCAACRTITPALVRLFQMDQYMDAQVERQKTAALFVGFVTRPRRTRRCSARPRRTTAAALAQLQPALFQELLPGEDVRFSQPPGVGSDFELFWYRVCLELAAGGRHAVLGADRRPAAGQLRLERAGLVEFRRRMEQLQHGVFVYQFCRPVWQRWLDDAVLAGALDLPGFAADPRRWRPAKWIPPRWDWIDPLKDLQAEKLAVDAGFKARSDVVEARATTSRRSTRGSKPTARARRRSAWRSRRRRRDARGAGDAGCNRRAAGQPAQPYWSPSMQSWYSMRAGDGGARRSRL